MCPPRRDNERHGETSSRLSAGVTPSCDGWPMENKLELHGIELRYVLTILLANCGTLTVADLDYELAQMGFVIRGLRSSKSISDALRWEVKAGRVHRRGRGSYGPGIIPRSTEYRIRRRVEALKERAMERQEAIQLSPPVANAFPADELDDDDWWASLGA